MEKSAFAEVVMDLFEDYFPKTKKSERKEFIDALAEELQNREEISLEDDSTDSSYDDE